MVYIFLSAFFYTIALMLSAAASRSINSTIVAALVNTISAVLPVVIIVPLINKRLVENGKMGILMAIAAGICVALYAIFINKSLQVNKVALVSPLVFGGVIFLSAVLSYFIFKEKLSPLHTTGLILVGLGLLTIVYSTATGK